MIHARKEGCKEPGFQAVHGGLPERTSGRGAGAGAGRIRQRARDVLSLFVVGTVCVGIGTTCVELGIIPGAPGSGNSNGDSANENTNTNPDGSNGPQVRLTVSNVVPTVGEEVSLQCTTVGEVASPVTFAYQTQLFRLVVNRVTGRATFVVDATDVGQALTFTCTATDAEGTGPPSNRVIVFPS